MKLTGHPSTHGHHINRWTCGSHLHAQCSGFSGDYDTYICGCCCHDGYYHPGELSDRDRAVIARLRGEAPPLTTEETT